jgi:hypothetical protein
MIGAPAPPSVTPDGSLRRFDTSIATGPMEEINSQVQAAKAKARGYLDAQPQSHGLVVRI